MPARLGSNPVPPAPRLKDQLDHLLARGDTAAAKEVAAEMLRRNPRDGDAWLGVAQVAIAADRLRVAEEALERAGRVLGDDHRVAYARAIADHYLARSDRAIDRLRALIARGAPNALDAHVFLADILHRVGRRGDVRALIESGGPWLADVRGRILAARALAAEDRPGAIAALEALSREGNDLAMRRNAGFEAVSLLDAAGEYRRAFDLATEVHRATRVPFDLGELQADIALQRELLGRGKPWFVPRVPPVEGIAFVAGMPRSGTTLLEQMLDRHSQAAGIGEYEGIPGMAASLLHWGAWPRGLGMLDDAQARELQLNYLGDARTPDVAGKRWLVDKSLHTWRWLPAVAAILPGARCLHMARDPRDTAVSLHLSNFHPRNFAWTQSMDLIRQVMELERAHTLEALRILGIAHEAIVYEDMVDAPAEHARRVAALLGIEPEPAMLAPEANTRTVLTLSHEQVRRPINRNSIGRWKNYEWAFGPEWDRLAGIHDARKRRD